MLLVCSLALVFVAFSCVWDVVLLAVVWVCWAWFRVLYLMVCAFGGMVRELDLRVRELVCCLLGGVDASMCAL